ncbi:hypothetical protein GBA52_012430 [Prunus armeniaca]|nr:hypothetical protein GBA52_012430 [Prunus armeniaca]
MERAPCGRKFLLSLCFRVTSGNSPFVLDDFCCSWMCLVVTGMVTQVLQFTVDAMILLQLLDHTYGFCSNLVFGVGKVIVAGLCGIGFCLCKIRGLAILVL